MADYFGKLQWGQTATTDFDSTSDRGIFSDEAPVNAGPIDLLDIVEAIQKLKRNKSIGSDGILV